MPHAAISPNHRYFAGTQFYWDTYFTVIGLVIGGKANIAKQMVDNLCFLYGKFGLVPARNSWTSLGRTQPPYLTQMAWEVYKAGAADKAWLNKVMNIAEKEYLRIWCGKGRSVKELGLSRYQPRYLKKLLTVYESGWDVSSRFAFGKTSVIPVDLNCQLYVYEKDIEEWHKLTGNIAEAGKWAKRAKKRRRAIDKYLWDEKSGLYYDYDLSTSNFADYKTLAGFYPLWSGCANQQQAERLTANLPVFEHAYGLAMTEEMPWKHRQWDYPNGWPPQQYVVVTGLRKYGFYDSAERISEKWLKLNLKLLKETGFLWEKYDVVKGSVGLAGRYPTQSGFAWTNGALLRMLYDSDTQQNDKLTQKAKK